MRSFLKRVPLPMAGLTLGLASLGNLYKLAGWQLVGNLTGGFAVWTDFTENLSDSLTRS